MSIRLEGKLLFRKKPTARVFKLIKEALLKGPVPIYDFYGNDADLDISGHIGVLTSVVFNKRHTTNTAVVELNEAARNRGCFFVPSWEVRITGTGELVISYL